VHPDHLGSTNVVTDENGNVVQALDFYPYGSTRISVATSTNEKRQFIGQFTDNSALSYLQARYYDSGRGQFISEDPLFISAKQNLSNPQSLNSYAYANDNPITLSDPTGLLGAQSVPGGLVGALKSLVSALQGLIANLQNPIGTTVGVGGAAISAATHSVLSPG
jgi:RHS repeat-associated protein